MERRWKGHEWAGLLTGKTFTAEELEAMTKRAGPNAEERYRQLVKEDDPFRVDDRTSSTKIQ